jgi:hypothetical protein
VLAADVGAGEAQVVAEEVAQEEARFRQTVIMGAVDADADPYGCGHEISWNERREKVEVRISRAFGQEQG